jgi:tetratricopeptide (TPR) repeat protein
VWREVAKAYNRAGVLHLRLGQCDQAIVVLDKALEVVARLIAVNPTDPDLKLLLAEIYCFKGRAYQLKRELVNEGPHLTRAAQAEYVKGIGLLEPLIENPALGPKFRDMLALLHNDLGLSFHHNDDLVKGEQHYREAIKIRANMAEEVEDLATRLFYRQQLALSRTNLAVILNATGRPDEAAEESRQALALLTEVHKEASAHLPGYKRGRLSGFSDSRPVPSDLADAHYQLAHSLFANGKSRAAEEEYRQTVEFEDQSFKEWPGEVLIKSFLALFRRRYGLILFAAGKRAEAFQQYQQSINLYRELQEKSGKKVANSDEYFDSLTGMGDLLVAEGKRKEAAVYYQEARDLANKRLEKYPEDANATDNLAWFLAVCADPDFRDPDRAVTLAKHAIQLSPDDGNIWSTLGVAQYRRGLWKDAVASLKKAEGLAGGTGIEIPLFLAMAHWRLGETEDARTCFDRADKRLQKHEIPPEEPSRWRAEAAELLGIKDQKK